MNSSLVLPFRRAFVLAASVAAVIVATPRAGDACDGQTVCAWRRTFYAYNALDMPLRPYFIPRLPGRCDRAICADNNGYGGQYSPQVGVGLDPVNFERLGQIPNDHDVEGLSAPPAAPRR